ncbi:hypothetical protein BJF77_15785 [Kocuria sp. CNJ-770]|uniref:hypothetical protein n=1 Tax=Kocuria sp. CNJ-770 TaxID=1904964 RepID=UPI00095EBAF9|nr:hypothetical protein BJF77_15785 [Kocuria sp. CNJ-770]
MAAAGLPALADKGYQGVGIGVHTPIKGGNLGRTNRNYNALLTQRWKALRHVALSPSRVGAIAAAALLLMIFECGSGETTSLWA